MTQAVPPDEPPAAPPGGSPVLGPDPARALRVLVVTTVHTPLDARIHHRQIRALRAAGAEVVYAAPWRATGTSPGAVVAGVRTLDLPRAVGRRRLGPLRAARRLIRRWAAEVDLVLLHDPELLLAVLGRLGGLPPVVLDVHEDLAASLADRHWIPARLRPVAVRGARALEAVAADRLAGLLLAEDSYRERLGGDHPVVPNLPWLPVEAQVAGTHRRVVYVGRISRSRGAAELVSLAARLADDPPRPRSPEADGGREPGAAGATEPNGSGAAAPIAVELIGPADADVRASVQAAHDAGRLTWHGFLPNEHAMELVQGSIAGLAPLHDLANYRGSMPTKVVEYLANGVPAIVTPLPVATALVRDADAGVVVDFGDADALTGAVRELAADPARAAVLGTRGREYVRVNRSWDAHAPSFVAHLAAVARTRRHRRARGRLPGSGPALLLVMAAALLSSAPATASAEELSACPPPLPGVVTTLPGTPPAIALTIDDGPHPVQTAQMLDVLATHDVRATFFVIGRNVRDHPELARRIIDEGHLVANHTFRHPTRPDDMDTIDLDARRRELDRATAVIEDATGVTPCFYRSPQGHHRSAETIALANRRGMTVSGWTISSMDTLQPPDRDEAVIAGLVDRVTSPLRPGGVLLFHDGGAAPKPNSAPAVDQVIRTYRAAGFDFVDPAGRPIPTVSANLVPRCPAALRLTMGFRDVAGDNPHLHAIACAADRGLVTGRSRTTFDPAAPVSRGQLATILDRHLAAAGRSPETPPHPFADLEGSVHRAAVERLAGAGLLAGRSLDRFAPDEPVRRDQLATLLANVLTSAHGLELVPGEAFADVTDDNPHAVAIARLHAIGVVNGGPNGDYGPSRPVTRAQAASMVLRMEASLAER